MTTNRAHLLILAAVACLPLACKDGGCGGGSSPSSTDASSATGSASAALSASASDSAMASASGSSSAMRARAMMVRAGGAAGALFRGASQLDLSDDQKTKVEQIATELREGDKEVESADGGLTGPRKEMKEMHDELVAGVKAGRIDGAKLEPHYVMLEKEAKERTTRDNEALAKLHGVLEPEQRKKLVDTVRKQEEERTDRAKKADAAQAAHAGPDGGARPSPTRRRYERYAKDLDLDTDQKKKLDAIVPVDDQKGLTAMREDASKRMLTALDLFAKDTFDPKTMPPPDMKLVRKPMDEQVKFYNGLLPILKPEQREKLATKLEKQNGGMEHGGLAGPGAPGGPGGGRRRGGGSGGNRDPGPADSRSETEDDSH